MASALELTAVGEFQAHHIKGFLPGRYDQLYLSHIWANVTPSNAPVLGTAWFSAQDNPGAPFPRKSRFLVWRGYSQIEVYRLDVAWGYDPATRGPVRLVYETTLSDACDTPYGEHRDHELATDMSFVRYANRTRIVSVQHKDELFFCIAPASSVRRIFMDDQGNLNVKRCGIPNWAGDFLSYAGSLVSGSLPSAATTYSYRLCMCDEKYRLSSPVYQGGDYGVTFTKAVSLTSNEIMFRYSVPSSSVGCKYAVLFRAAQGTEDYYSVTCRSQSDQYIPLTSTGTITVWDTTSEANLLTGDLCPEVGQNNPPPVASFLAVHGKRLWCNDRSLGQWVQRGDAFPWVYNQSDRESAIRLWASNLDAATQFNASTVTDDVSLGTALIIGTDTGDTLTAFASLGAHMGVWTANMFYLLSGDSLADWVLYKQADIGCVSGPTLQVCDNKPYWLAEDGVYVYDGSGQPVCISLPINDLINGPRAGAIGSMEARDA
jgi:hypothetical protein